jgi:hypothetical protein
MAGDSVPQHIDVGFTTVSSSSMAGVVDAILEVGQQRNALLKNMRAALITGNIDQVLGTARKLCGLANDEESNRAHPSIN